jgi:predicted ATPase
VKWYPFLDFWKAHVQKDPVIRNLSLQGFRSFVKERIEFDNPTFLVGRNGSGKSNVVDAFALLAESMTSTLSSAVARRGGVASVFHRTPFSQRPLDFGLAVDFGPLDPKVEGGRFAFLAEAHPNLGFTVTRESCSVQGASPASFDRQGGMSLPGLNLPVPHAEPSSLLLPSAGGLESFAPVVRTLSEIRAYTIDPAKLREPQVPDSGSALHPQGENAANVLRNIQQSSPQDLERIQEFLAAILPYPMEVHAVQQGPRLSLEFHQKSGGRTLVLDASSISEGTLRILGLILAVFQRPAPSVLLIEEPETSLHPGSLGLVLDLIQAASYNSQVIVTTHNPELLDLGKWIEERHLRIVYWEDGATRVSRIGRASREALQEHLMGAGELLRSNLLDEPPPSHGLPETSLFEALP